MASRLITPYGERLVDLRVASHEIEALRERALTLPSVQLSERALCDLELLAVGAFSPLDRFMGSADHERVIKEMRLSSGDLFPIPLTLPVADRSSIGLDREITLRDARNEILAVLRVEDIYEWDLEEVSREIFGTADPRHPLVAEMHGWGRL